MADETDIAWADSTFNPWIGCQKVSPGCDHCYAEDEWDRRRHRVQWGPHGERSLSKTWGDPRRWQRKAAGFIGKRGPGFPRMVFCASLCDVFDNKAPDGARDDLWKLIRETLDLDWLLLTKRPENIAKMLPADWGDGWPHVWLGATAEDQEWFDHRWPILNKIPAVVHFISYEPALGPLKLGDARPDWIICGGEKCLADKDKARFFDPQWARDLRDECAATGVLFFMKQMRNDGPIPDDLFVRQWPQPRKSQVQSQADLFAA
jgi:protein gp37